jgi:hypothetical protein
MDKQNCKELSTCDWCKSANVEVTPHRDFEEGSSGMLYDVCDKCIKAENDRVELELAEYDNND